MDMTLFVPQFQARSQTQAAPEVPAVSKVPGSADSRRSFSAHLQAARQDRPRRDQQGSTPSVQASPASTVSDGRPVRGEETHRPAEGKQDSQSAITTVPDSRILEPTASVASNATDEDTFADDGFQSGAQLDVPLQGMALAWVQVTSHTLSEEDRPEPPPAEPRMHGPELPELPVRTPEQPLSGSTLASDQPESSHAQDFVRPTHSVLPEVDTEPAPQTEIPGLSESVSALPNSEPKPAPAASPHDARPFRPTPIDQPLSNLMREADPTPAPPVWSPSSDPAVHPGQGAVRSEWSAGLQQEPMVRHLDRPEPAAGKEPVDRAPERLFPGPLLSDDDAGSQEPPSDHEQGLQERADRTIVRSAIHADSPSPDSAPSVPFVVAAGGAQAEGSSPAQSVMPATPQPAMLRAPGDPGEPPLQPLSRSVVFEVAQPDLGRVHVRVSMTNDQVHTYFTSDRADVGQVLFQGQDRLRSALQTSDLDMGQFRVDIDRQSGHRSFEQGPSPDQGRAWQTPQSSAGRVSNMDALPEGRPAGSRGILNLVA